MTDDEVRQAAERLIVRAEECVPEVPWVNVSVPKPDILIVARAALAGSEREAALAEAGRIAAGALMLVRSADSLREKDQIALDALEAFMCASGLPRGSVTPEQARAALAAQPQRRAEPECHGARAEGEGLGG